MTWLHAILLYNYSPKKAANANIKTRPKIESRHPQIFAIKELQDNCWYIHLVIIIEYRK